MTPDKIAALLLLFVPSLILAVAGWQYGNHWVGRLLHVLGLIGVALVLFLVGVSFWVQHS